MAEQNYEGAWGLDYKANADLKKGYLTLFITFIYFESLKNLCK